MSNNIYGIDLGTSNMKVYCKATGKILNEKNTIAIINKNQMYAYGDAAYAMYEKAPEQIQVSFPIICGVIADFNNMQTMIQEFLEKHAKGKTRGAEFIVAVPTDITEVEKKAFFDIFYKLPSDKLKPQRDKLKQYIQNSIKNNEVTNWIYSYIKKNFNLVIGRKTAKTLKEELGSGTPGMEKSMVIVGRDVVSGLPIEMEITAEVIYAAIKDNLNSICNSIKMILEKTPPELAKDIIHSGIYITGGGSKIHNLITNIKVNSCENPEECAVRGLNKIVSDEKYKHLGFSMKSKIYK